MAQHHLPLTAVYKGWDIYQQHLVTAITLLSPEQLTRRAAPQLRSLDEQVAHIIAVRARWLYLDLHEGGPELDPLMSWDGWSAQPSGDAPPARSVAELVSGIETTWQVLQEALGRWSVADLVSLYNPQ